MESWVLEKIRRAKAEGWTRLDLGNAGLEELPEELFELSELTTLLLGNTYFDVNSGVWRRSENSGEPNQFQFLSTKLSRLTNLTALDLSFTSIRSVKPLAALTKLTKLRLPRTPIQSVRPLAGLTNLTELNLSETNISSVKPLAALRNLISLDLSVTGISSVEPVTALTNLTSLSLHFTEISSVKSLAALTNLTWLDLSFTQVCSIEPLVALARLNSLVLASTPLDSAEPLTDLTDLTKLNLSNTPISSAEPLAALTKLTLLYLSNTPIVTADPLASLTNLALLHLDGCGLKRFPRELLTLPCLSELTLYGNPIDDCPREILGDKAGVNCLFGARAHFADLDQQSVADRELKLILLGNGRVGKTSVIRRLIHNSFDPQEEPTHGIRMDAWRLDTSGGPVRINVWDFGGQDIYHGTHRLFLKNRAIFLIVWDRVTERQPYHEHNGLRYENLPLAYWLDYVQTINPNAPLIIVENKCDDGLGIAVPVDQAFTPSATFSARVEQYGRESLTARIKEICQRELAHTAGHEIGTGRWSVKQTLRRYMEEDEQRAAADRKHRMISYEHFCQLCDAEDGKVSSADELLRFLHNSGVLFHQSNLFDNQIILDQRWVIEAIYTLFHRENCLRQLRERSGRFKRSTLHDLAWGDEFSEAEQRLFITFMESCAICFRISDREIDDPEYIAPELLPPRESLESDIVRWRRSADSDAAIYFRYGHRFLHQGVMQRFVVDVGRQFREGALYWKDGVMLEQSDASPHGNARSVAEIQCRRNIDGDPANGEIVITVWGGGGPNLLNRLRNTLERLHEPQAQVSQVASLDGEDWVDLSKLHDAELVGKVVSQQGRILDVQPFRFLLHRDTDQRLVGPQNSHIPPPPITPDESTMNPPANDSRPKVFISHSSKDKPFVRKLVDKLISKNVHVWFDEREMGVGDSIAAGISQGLEEADYLLVVLSKNSAQSRWVQNELNAALMDEASRRGIVVLPAVTEDCEVPILLRDRVYADFRTDFSVGLNSLMRVFLQESESAQSSETGHAAAFATSGCRATLAKLTLADLRRRMTQRMNRTEVATIWFDVLESQMDDELPGRTLGECVIALLDRAGKRQKLDKVIDAICSEREDLASP